MKIVTPLLIAASLALPIAANAATSTWELDGNHSTAGFSVTHMMVNTVRGAFGKSTGTIVLDEDDVTKSKIDATIDASTVDTRVADRDKHLKSEDFFFVEKYPAITFKSTSIEKGAEGKLRVTGDLTIRGVTKPVVLDVTGPSAAIKNPWGQPVRTVAATGSISRKEFGLNWNKALEAGGVLVSDAVAIEINAELVPKAPAADAAKVETKKGETKKATEKTKK